MKSLKNFEPVMKAISKVATEVSVGHDNGTLGREFLCHYYDKEETFDKARQEILQALGRAMIKDEKHLIKTLQDKLVGLPPTKVNLIFKLTEPIKRLIGTKVQHDGETQYHPIMNNVKFIYVPEDAIDMEFLSFEETPDKDVDKFGNEAVIIKLKLDKGILDVKEGKLNWKDQEIRESRAYVTPVSFRAMQIAGKIMGEEQNKKRKMYGYGE